MTPIVLYLLILISILGVVIVVIIIWHMFVSRATKGSSSFRLSLLFFITSIICIALFPYLFIQLGAFPPAKDIKPTLQLSVPNKDRLHFAIGSDAHFGAGTNIKDQTKAMLDQIANPANKYDVFFFLGDLVEYGFMDSHWKEALDTFSPTASSVPTLFVPGNHDTLLGGLSRYIEYCGVHTSGLQDGSKLWYRVDAGNMHFLVLDVEWSAETFTKTQKTWLEIQLSTIPVGDWKIVMSHGFYYSSGISSSGWNWYDNPETISALVPLFEQYGVDMVFSGHNHCLELLQHSGIYYAVCGGFGGKLDSVPTYISASSIWLQSGQFGFADVFIDGDLATLNFRDPDSNVLKSLTLTKQK